MSYLETVDPSSEHIPPPEPVRADFTFETKNVSLEVSSVAAKSSLDPRTAFANLKPMIVQLSERTERGLATLGPAACYSVKYRYLNQVHDGFLYRVRGNCYGLLNYDKAAAETPLDDYLYRASSEAFESGFIEGLKRPQLVEASNFAELEKQFSLRPPVLKPGPARQPVESPQHIKDPLEYLKSRYYSILYSHSTPLSYFPKTALSRVKVLTDSDGQRREILSHMILSIEKLDLRHSGKYGVLQLLDPDVEHQLEAQFEVSTQTDFIAKQDGITKGTEKDHEAISRLSLRLKMREAQMQLILIFELLCAKEIDEAKFLSQVKTDKQKRSKPSLVRRKKSKKIIPTFLGMGVNSIDTPVPSNEAKFDDFAILQTINNIVEKMDIWDTLHDSKSDALMTYVAYVLVPYFNKKLPLTIKHIISRIKGSTLKTKSTSSKKGRSSTKQKTKSLSDLSLKRSKSLASTSSDSIASIDMDTFAPPISLKRSKSNLSSKHLHKRQVDLSNPVAKAATEEPQDSFIFAKARKIKSMHNFKPAKASQSQVFATPVKPKRHAQTLVAETPVSGTNVAEALRAQAIASPEDHFTSPVTRRTHSSELLRTPLPVLSSPVVSTEKKRPGEPVAFQSPFFNGSPIGPNQIFDDDSDNDDGIFKKKPRVRRY